MEVAYLKLFFVYFKSEHMNKYVDVVKQWSYLGEER